MPLDIKVDILQCNKDESIQCEDYFKESEYNKNKKIYCLCDGASESYNSLLWAKIIANKYLEHEYTDGNFKSRPDNFLNFLEVCSNEYKQEVEFDTLPWSHQLAFLRGSFSTLLAVSYSGDEHIRIFAVGDSIALLSRNGGKKEFFPDINIGEFKNNPKLISSIPSYNDFLKKDDYIKKHKKTWKVKENDILFLMTDAIAEWLMMCDRFKELENLFKEDNKEESFKKFVSEKRSRKQLRTDDTTVVKLEFQECKQ